MAEGEDQQGYANQLSPPTSKKLDIKDKWWLVLELIWLLLLIPPFVLLDLFRKIFPGPGKSLKGQVVVVTGAGRGLGRGLALAFAKEGCKVAIVDVNKTNAKDVAAEIVKNTGVAKAYFTNVAKIEEIKDLHESVKRDLGPVDILVNNAGLIFAGGLEDSTDDEIRAVIAVNLTSQFWMVREFIPSMKARNFGHIVSIASITSFGGGINGSAYVASKFGVRGINNLSYCLRFMEVVRFELQAIPNNKIKTTTVYPYFINTSADYIKQWDLRYPPISVDEAVKETMFGVKRDHVNVTIPSFYFGALQLLSLCPQYIFDKSRDIVYCNITPPTKEVKKTIPNTAIIEDLSKDDKRSI